jgi:hypothetical protein
MASISTATPQQGNQQSPACALWLVEKHALSTLVAQQLKVQGDVPPLRIFFLFSKWTHVANGKKCTWMQKEKREKGGQKDEYQSGRTHKD